MKVTLQVLEALEFALLNMSEADLKAWGQDIQDFHNDYCANNDKIFLKILKVQK